MNISTHTESSTDSRTPTSAANLKPEPPLAKRLNRNALTVAAVVMGVTVLTAVVVLNPSRDSTATSAHRQARTEEGPPIPARPAFLDVPVQTPAAAMPRPPLRDSAIGVVTRSTRDGAPAELLDSARTRPSRVPHETTYPVAFVQEGTVQPKEPSARERAFVAAVSSPTIVGASNPSTSSATAARGTDSPSLAHEESELLNLGDSVLRASLHSPASSASVAQGSPFGQSNRAGGANSDARRTFLDAAGDLHGSTTIARMEPTGSPYTLRAGTVIPGVLLSGITSDLPGDIIGQVSRNVYDSRTQRVLLIPKGSRLIGTYDNQIASGQNRLLVAWTRLILPDGQSMRLPGLALKDATGLTGAKGDVDNHWRRVFGNALLLSAIGAGVQLSQPQQASVLAPPSAGQVAAGALGQELSNVALEIIRRGMDAPPTITIRQGQAFNVFLNGDLVFDGPYVEAQPNRAR